MLIKIEYKCREMKPLIMCNICSVSIADLMKRNNKPSEVLHKQ